MNMDDSTSTKQRILSVVRGGQYAKRPSVVAKADAMVWQLDSEMQDAFAGIHGEDGLVPSEGIYHVRERRQYPWRTLARRFREARAANAPIEQVMGPIRVLELWVKELYRDEPHRGRAA